MNSELAYEKPNLLKLILIDSLFLCLNIIGFIILLVKIKNCYTITTTSIYDITPDYTTDKRFKSGVRQIGESRKIVGTRDLSQEELDNLRKKGKYHKNYLLVILFIGLFNMIFINKSISSQTQTNTSDTTIIKKDSIVLEDTTSKKKEKIDSSIKTKPTHKSNYSYNSTSSNSYNHIGKRGGVYHYSKSGKKVYSKRH